MSKSKVYYKNVEEMLNDLHADDRGHYYICQCPSCEKKEAFVYKNNPRQINCNRAENCGERFLVSFDNQKDLEDVKLKQMQRTYPSLTKDQIKSLDWLQRALNHLDEFGVSEVLNQGYRGLSRETTKGFVVDFQNKNLVNLMFHKTHSLFNKDYRNNDFMCERNLVLPIYGEDGHVERILLRSSINPNPKPKEIQLIVNPSKEARDFFVDVPDKAKTIVITEALFDGLSFREVDPDVGFIALTGSQKLRQVEKYLKENRSLLADKHIILAMDNDKAGMIAEEKLRNIIEKNRLGRDLSSFELPKDISDPNDYLRFNKEAFQKDYDYLVKSYSRKKDYEMEVGY